MHASVMAYLREVLTPERVQGRRVLEVGSLDVEGDYPGTARDVCVPLGVAEYEGIDARRGRNVDRAIDAERAWVTGIGEWDVIVSTEMLEHAEHWLYALGGMVRALRPGGFIVLTTRGPGAGRHDHPGDHWRFTPGLLIDALCHYGVRVIDWREDSEIPGVLLTGRHIDRGALIAEPAP